MQKLQWKTQKSEDAGSWDICRGKLKVPYGASQSLSVKGRGAGGHDSWSLLETAMAALGGLLSLRAAPDELTMLPGKSIYMSMCSSSMMHASSKDTELRIEQKLGRCGYVQNTM